jgi:hypothetical protein
VAESGIAHLGVAHLADRLLQLRPPQCIAGARLVDATWLADTNLRIVIDLDVRTVQPKGRPRKAAKKETKA